MNWFTVLIRASDLPEHYNICVCNKFIYLRRKYDDAWLPHVIFKSSVMENGFKSIMMFCSLTSHISIAVLHYFHLDVCFSACWILIYIYYIYIYIWNLKYSDSFPKYYSWVQINCHWMTFPTESNQVTIWSGNRFNSTAENLYKGVVCLKGI